MAKTYYSMRNARTKASKRKAYPRPRSAYATLSRSFPRNDARNSGGITISKSVYFEDYLGTSIVGEVAKALTFQLSQIADYTSYMNSFDQFRINYVDVCLIPKVNVNMNVNGADHSLGILGSSIDLDVSALTPTTSLAVLATKDTFKFTRGTSLHKRRIYPLVAQAVAAGTVSGTAFATSGPRRNKLWIDCSFPTTMHNGMQIVVGDADNTNITYDMIIKYNISFRAAQ